MAKDCYHVDEFIRSNEEFWNNTKWYNWVMNTWCYLNACTSHLYQTLVLPNLICTELICTTPWIYHGGPGTIEKRPNDFCRRQKSWVGAPAPGSPVRASFPECVRPYLEDGKNEVWYRWARYRWAWYRWVGKPEIGETKLCKLRGLAVHSCILL